ncbi:uncharacterized protein [Lepeophtheirus salmonis]|uniref:uncharacterized protein isoform X2 n=1 Tax=Lepeophtheirus salmonis TaxID=72036 RepID=UPI001AE586AE|nr:THAP domain-containing protein 2-like isoform X2 [Lepeophtheirus salmonis]
MLTCCCSGCRTGCRQHKKAKHESGSPISNSNYSLHIFPKDEDLKNNRHFHESCFRSDRKETRSKLKSNAIPTIFPNEEDIQYSLKLPSLTKILNTSAAFEKRTGYRKTKGSEHNSDSTTNELKHRLHIFPKNEELKDKWIRAIHRENFVPTKNARVCSRHFHESCYSTERRDSNTYRKHLNLKRERLQSNAVPTIFPDSPAYVSVLPTPARSTSLSSSKSSSKESSPVPEETVNLSASMEVDKSVGIMLSSKQCRYLKRQFRKLKDMSQSHSEFLAKELKCPQDYISECFSLYKDYIKCQTETNSLLKSSNKDPLEFNEDELMKELEKDYEDFEVLNFEDETVRDHLVVVD